MVTDERDERAPTGASIGAILEADRLGRAPGPSATVRRSVLGRPWVALVAVATLVVLAAFEWRSAKALPTIDAETRQEMTAVARERLARAYEYAESVRATTGAYPTSLDPVRDSLALGPIEYLTYDGRFTVFTRVGEEPVWVGSLFDLEAFRKDGSRVVRTSSR
jgi:hypothetical protein